MKTFSTDSTASKDVITHLCCFNWGNKQSEPQFHCKPVPGKLLSKTRKSGLQADLQGKGGQRAPSAMVSAVIVAGLEGTGGKVVRSAGHPEAMLQGKASSSVGIDTQHSRFFYRLWFFVS